MRSFSSPRSATLKSPFVMASAASFLALGKLFGV
ncbi:hypothetical protein J519_4245, partial [Acinetobacter baumannii 1294217]